MDNEIITPENNKLIAKWMGLNVVDIVGCEAVIEYKKATYEYNPITSTDQSREIEKRLLAILDIAKGFKYQIYYFDGEWDFHNRYDSISNKSKSFELAIYKAALKEAMCDDR